MRKDGKFIGVDGSIPEGQGIVMAHLNECHELLEMVCFSFRLVMTECSSCVQLKQRMDDGQDEEDEDLDDDGYTFESGSSSGEDER